MLFRVEPRSEPGGWTSRLPKHLMLIKSLNGAAGSFINRQDFMTAIKFIFVQLADKRR